MTFFSMYGLNIGVFLSIGFIIGYVTALQREVNRRKKIRLQENGKSVSQNTKEEKSE